MKTDRANEGRGQALLDERVALIAVAVVDDERGVRKPDEQPGVPVQMCRYGRPLDIGQSTAIDRATKPLDSELVADLCTRCGRSHSHDEERRPTPWQHRGLSYHHVVAYTLDVGVSSVLRRVGWVAALMAVASHAQSANLFMLDDGLDGTDGHLEIPVDDYGSYGRNFPNNVFDWFKPPGLNPDFPTYIAGGFLFLATPGKTSSVLLS
jgi:hypothetical protein